MSREQNEFYKHTHIHIHTYRIKDTKNKITKGLTKGELTIIERKENEKS